MLVHSDSADGGNAPLLQICRMGDVKSFKIMLKAAEEKGNYPSLATVKTLLHTLNHLTIAF